jgi:hypothetical protein
MSVAPVLPLRPGENPAAGEASPAGAGAALRDAHALTARLSRQLGIPTATTLLEKERPRPVLPALAGLFSRGGLPRGETVALTGRSALSLALAACAAVTAEGGWCAGVGLGEPAVSALADLGVDLSRFVCADVPAQDWLRVVSVLVGSFAVLIAAPGFSPSAAERSRLEARLRESGTTLLLLEEEGAGRGRGERIEVLEETWEGLEHGFGHLLRRTLRLRSARTGEHRIVLPGERGQAAAAEPATSAPEAVAPEAGLRLLAGDGTASSPAPRSRPLSVGGRR